MANKPGRCGTNHSTWRDLGIPNVDEHLILIPATTPEVFTVCTCTIDDRLAAGDIQYDKSVSVRLGEEEALANVEPVKQHAWSTPGPVVNNEKDVPTPSGAQFASPGASKSGFSFKDFSSSLKDSRDASTPTSATRTASTPAITSHASPLFRMRQKMVDVFLPPSTSRTEPMHFKVCNLGKAVTASSISVEMIGTLDCSVATRKRMQAWFVGMILAEGFWVHDIAGVKVSGKVRRVVPSFPFVRCTKDTRVILETAPVEVRLDQTSSEPVISPFGFVLSRLEDKPSYEGFTALPFPKGVLLYGPPGTGKSHSVRDFIKRLEAIHVPVLFQAPQPGDFKDQARGDFVLKQTFSEAKRFVERNPSGLGIIFLDELDSYTMSRDSNQEGGHTGRLLTLMDGIRDKDGQNRIIVIGATNHVDVIDPALRRPGRFDKEMLFRLPTGDERYWLVRKILDGLRVDGETIARFCRDRCVGYSQADIISWLRKVEQNNWEAGARVFDDLAPPKASALRDAIHFSEDMQPPEIGGQEEAKMALKMAIEWPITKRDVLGRFGMIALFRGVLLYGPPGCAKTSLCRSIAWSNRGRASFYSLSGADVYSSGVGEAEACIRRAFARARATAPSILFFDEVDSLVGSREETSRSGASDSVQSRVLSTFLNEMDGIDSFASDAVVVVGATNCPENIDRALLRPGRFDKLVFVGPPDPRSVLELELKKMSLIGQIDVDALISDCTFMSGADISGACRLAALRALSRGPAEVPTQSDFHNCLKDATRSCRPEVLERYLAFQNGNQHVSS